jgi:soluble lytic murein transglycosylase-like protein
MLLCSTSITGCSNLEPKPPVAAAFAGSVFTPDASGLVELLKETENAPTDTKIQRLRSFIETNPAAPAKQKASYALGRILQKQTTRKEYEEAVTRYREAAQYQPLFERSNSHLAELGAVISDEALSRQALQAIFRSEATDKKDKAAALYGLGQSHMRAGERDKAREYFSELQKFDPTSNYALGAAYYLGTIALADATSAQAGSATGSEDKRAQALEAYRRYLRESPDGRFAEDIILTLSNLPGYTPTAEDHALFASAKYARGHWRDALEEWQKAGTSDKWYEKAVCLQCTGRGAETRAALLSGISNHPNDDSVEDAATMLARLSNRQQSASIWKIVATKSSKFGDTGLYNVAIRAASTADSLPYYRQLISKYPTSRYASEATWWLAWSEIQAGRGAQAIPLLQTGAARYPDTRAGSRFAYWIGKIHERAKKKDLAVAAYQRTIQMQPWNYYAYRSQQRIKALNGGHDEGWATNPGRRVSWSSDTAQQWSWPEPPAAMAKQEGDTLAALTELRQWDECLSMVPKEKYALRSFYLAKLDQPMPAINSASKELSGTPNNSELWQMAYPLLHAQLIAREAPVKRVDPFLVQALIREESRYNHQAVSSSNALGLMQLLPGTAYGVAKRIGVKLNNRSDIHHPHNNIRLGTDYLGYVHERHDGNALFAVASYNGGPNAVARWRKSLPADMDVFVENIPFRETRDYVRKVFGSYWNYRAIYGPKA